MASNKKRKNSSENQLSNTKTAKATSSGTDPILPVTPIESIGFAGLPPNVRAKIYRYLGLVRKCVVHLNDPKVAFAKVLPSGYEDDVEEVDPRIEQYAEVRRRILAARTYCQQYFHAYQYAQIGMHGAHEYPPPPCVCPRPTLAIFRVCKWFAFDARGFFFQTNTFRIVNRVDVGLEVLRGMPKIAKSKLSRLDIVLGTITNSDFRSRRGVCVDLRSLMVLLDTDFEPGRIEFTFQCDISGLRTEALKAFTHNLFPTNKSFKACTMILNSMENVMGRRHDTSRTFYGDIAQFLVVNMSHGKDLQSTKPFRYNELPTEVRLNVLKQTSLVASDQDIANGKGFFVQAGKIFTKKPCCGKCNRSVQGHFSLSRHACHCFGSRASASSTCECPGYHRTLFLVDKRTRVEAREVFATQNRFIFAGKHVETLRFLKAHGDFLKNMRSADLTISAPTGEPWPAQNNEVIQFRQTRWSPLNGNTYVILKQIMELVAVRGTIHRLELSLHLQGHKDPQYPEGEVNQRFLEHIKFHISKEARGLKAFKVFASNCIGMDETAVEKAVMGPSYDSSQFGKMDSETRLTGNPHLEVSEYHGRSKGPWLDPVF